MKQFMKKAARVFHNINCCLARAEVYLHHAQHSK